MNVCLFANLQCGHDDRLSEFQLTRIKFAFPSFPDAKYQSSRAAGLLAPHLSYHCDSDVGGSCESDAAVEAVVDAQAVPACALRGL